METPERVAATTPVVIEEQIVKVARGYPIPEGWTFSRLIYETTDLYGTWDVMLVYRARPSDA